MHMNNDTEPQGGTGPSQGDTGKKGQQGKAEGQLDQHASDAAKKLNTEQEALNSKISELEKDNKKYRDAEKKRAAEQEKTKLERAKKAGEYDLVEATLTKQNDDSLAKINALEKTITSFEEITKKQQNVAAEQVEKLIKDIRPEDLEFVKSIGWSEDPREQLSKIQAFLAREGKSGPKRASTGAGGGGIAEAKTHLDLVPEAELTPIERSYKGYKQPLHRS